jgi:hypothetical protein
MLSPAAGVTGSRDDFRMLTVRSGVYGGADQETDESLELKGVAAAALRATRPGLGGI